MISRRILAAFALLWAFPCLAQTGSIKTPAQLNSEINTTFPNNTVGQITPAGVRQVALDQVASVPFLNVTNVFTASQSFPNGVIVTGGTITGAAWTGGTITGLPTPVNPSDAVTLAYVNSAVTTGINILAPSRLATASVLPNTPTYSNGTAGVGATLTASTNSTLTVDGTVANLNDIVLVKNQSSAFQNGIYSLTTAGSGSAAWILTRVSYFNIASQMKVGSYTFITAGTANGNSAYTLQSTVVTVGTDALTWALFSSTGIAVTSLDGANGNISVQTGSLKVVSGQLSVNVLSSRTFAQTQNLSNFNSVQTLGYGAAGDGGGANFKNIGSAPFIDSFITTYSFSGGSGYTNGSYFGATFLTSGKNGPVRGVVTVSVGAVTAVNIQYTPGNQCNIGDVYTTSSVTGGSFSITVTGCSAPLGSFTDTAGTHWQIVPQGFPLVTQFGAVGDWNVTTNSGTDNFNSIQAADWFAAFSNGFPGGGGFWGGKIVFPQGTFMSCGNTTTPLVMSYGVTWEGAGSQASGIHMCDTYTNTANFIEQCDPNWHSACFDNPLKNMQLNALRAAAGPSGTPFAMIHSRSSQDFGGLDHVYIYGGLRACAWYEHGDGGASSVQIQYVSCTTDSGGPQIQIGNTTASGLNFGTTIIEMTDIVLGGSSSGSVFQSGNGVLILGGWVTINGLHCENMPACVEINTQGASTNNGMITLNNINGGSGSPAPTFVGVVQLDSTNTQQNTGFSMIQQPGTGSTVLNGVSGGTNYNAPVGQKTIICALSCS